MKFLSSFALALAVVVAAPAYAQPPSPASVAAKLRENFPERPFGAVAATPIPGLFEVVTGDSISYVDATGTYIIFGGKMVDYKKQVNMTEQRLGEVNKIDPKQLPVADALKIVKGNGQRVLYLFTDPNCPYCKKLETEDLKSVENVTIYTFLYPILGQGSRDKVEHLWCSKDRAKAWADLMLRGVAPPAVACDTAAVTRTVALGQQLRVSSTPTMFAADGRRLAGAVGATALNSFLDTSKVAAK